MPPQTPTLSDVIEGALEARLDDVHTSMPGRVVSFDRDSCTANVQPTIKKIYTREDGTEFAANLPVIPSVPVVFPGSGSAAAGGTGSFGITFPINKGDEVLLVFSSASLDSWKLSRDQLVAPKPYKPHALSDAIAIPGLRSIANAKKSTSGSGAAYAGSAYMTIHGDDIRMGGISANDPAVRKSDLDAVVNAFNLRLVGHTHPYLNVTTPATTSPGVVALGPATAPACSQVVKLESGF